MTSTKPKSPALDADEAERRYAICPASGYLHDSPLAVPIFFGKKGHPFGVCICKTRFFVGRRWTRDIGLTREEAEAICAWVVG